MLVAKLYKPDEMWLGILIGTVLPLTDLVIGKVRKYTHTAFYTAEVQRVSREKNEV